MEDPSLEDALDLPSIRMTDDDSGNRGQSILYRVMISVVDLDPKPINRIRRWLNQKEEMLKTYSNFKNSSSSSV